MPVLPTDFLRDKSHSCFCPLPRPRRNFVAGIISRDRHSKSMLIVGTFNSKKIAMAGASFTPLLSPGLLRREQAARRPGSIREFSRNINFRIPHSTNGEPRPCLGVVTLDATFRDEANDAQNCTRILPGAHNGNLHDRGNCQAYPPQAPRGAFCSNTCAGGRKFDDGRDPRLPCARTLAAGCASLSAGRCGRRAAVTQRSESKTPPDTELSDGVRGNDTTAKQCHGSS
jgi:hypothetical protein